MLVLHMQYQHHKYREGKGVNGYEVIHRSFNSERESQKNGRDNEARISYHRVERGIIEKGDDEKENIRIDHDVEEIDIEECIRVWEFCVIQQGWNNARKPKGKAVHARNKKNDNEAC